MKTFQIDIKGLSLNNAERGRLLSYLKRVDALTPDKICEFVDSTRGTQLSQYQAVSMISRYALLRGYISPQERDNIMCRYRLSRFDKPEEYKGEILIDAVDRTSTYPERDKAILFETFLNMRNGTEIVNLTLGTYQPAYSHSMRSYVKAVDDYLKTVPFHSTNLYVNKDGSRMNNYQLYTIYNKMSEHIRRRISIKTLRQRSVRKLIEKEGLIQAQKILGIKKFWHVKRYMEEL